MFNPHDASVSMPEAPIVVMTDLDGTLLDHDTYSTVKAAPTLKRLHELRIPLIFNTSKTHAEVKTLKQDMDIRYPHVCENGSAIYLDDYHKPVILGSKIKDIIKVLAQLRRDGFLFRSFNDMPASEVTAITGLTLNKSTLAKARVATEPMLWQGNDAERVQFQAALGDHDLKLLKGGRFWHVMGPTDKSEGVHFLRQHYQSLWQRSPIIIALGDGENDRAMLEAADFPIVIPGKHATLTLKNTNTRTAIHHGPKGWHDELAPLIERLLKENRSG
ncbi:MAG: HAD-IIB family hydrolase [Oleibacter sp.]|nr:HAD-IIB family hydrolase [Thalassolituus sp.]